MNHFLAEKHYEMSLAKRFFADWRHITRSSIIKLRVLAEEHYNKTILINTFRIWSEVNETKCLSSQATFTSHFVGEKDQNEESAGSIRLQRNAIGGILFQKLAVDHCERDKEAIQTGS